MWWDRWVTTVSDDGVSETSDKKKRHQVRWDEVLEIRAVSLDNLPHPVDYLILKSDSDAISVSELEDCIKPLEDQLAQRFPGFPDNWQARLVEAGVDVYCLLWSRPAATPPLSSSSGTAVPPGP